MRTRTRWTLGLTVAAALAVLGPAPFAPGFLVAVHAAPAGDGVLLDVTSEPDGAWVTIDGKEAGKTPLRNVRLAPGKHVLRFEAKEHVAAEKEVELVADGSLFVPTVKLVPWPRLVPEPLAEGVTVTVDGEAPNASGRVAPGKHVVTFARAGFAAQRVEVDAEAGKEIPVRAAPWEGFQGRIDLSAVPKDVTAHRDGVPVTEPLLTFPAAGTVPLRFTRAGHFPQTVLVEVRLGETTKPALAAWVPIPAVLAARRKGLGRKLDPVVAAGLNWLERHQHADGRWACALFAERCTTPGLCAGDGAAYHDVGVTGLATLAMLGAGSTTDDGPQTRAVAKAVAWLASKQDKEGCVGPRTSFQFQYDHAAASTALVEAWWLSRDPKLRPAAQAAVQFVQASQNPYLAWRYGVRNGDNDTSVTIWNSLVLRTAMWADLDVDPQAFSGPLAWIDKMTEPEFGKVGYQNRGGLPARIAEDRGAWDAAATSAGLKTVVGHPTIGGMWIPGGGSQFDMGRVIHQSRKWPGSESEALTAGGALVRRICSDPAEILKDEFIAKGAALVDKKRGLDVDRGSYDLHYAVFGSLLHAQLGDRTLQAWRESMERGLVESQTKGDARNPCHTGSWNPDFDPFGKAGGRVYATAMALLALEAPARFPRVVPTKRK